MTDNESFLASLGVTDAVQPLPDQVWEQILAVALDPTTPSVDTDLVPEQDDVPVVLDDADGGDIVLEDDDLTSSDGRDTAATSHHDTATSHDDPHHHGIDDQPLVMDDSEPIGSADHIDEYVDLGHVDVDDDSY